MTTSRSLETLTAADFRDLSSNQFRLTIQSPESPRYAVFEVQLADVIEGAGNLSFRKSFSVLFHGPIEPVLPQGIYRLEHDELGVLELFIVPIGPGEKPVPAGRPTAMRYEAVFG